MVGVKVNSKMFVSCSNKFPFFNGTLHQSPCSLSPHFPFLKILFCSTIPCGRRHSRHRPREHTHTHLCVSDVGEEERVEEEGLQKGRKEESRSERCTTKAFSAGKVYQVPT